MKDRDRFICIARGQIHGALSRAADRFAAGERGLHIHGDTLSLQIAIGLASDSSAGLRSRPSGANEFINALRRVASVRAALSEGA